MQPAKIDGFHDRMPQGSEIRSAKKAKDALSSQLKKNAPTEVAIGKNGGESITIALSPALTHTFLDLLELVSSGKGIRMIPVESELTTQQASDILNVSRDYLIELLNQNEIVYTVRGRHRRILADHLFNYKQQRDEKRKLAMDELMKMDGELI